MPTVPSLSITLEPDGEPDYSEEIPDHFVRAILSDAFAFIRGTEANQALAAVTLEELMADQIQRNGESAKANSSQYNPYGYDASKTQPASETSAEIANFLGGSDTGGPTKLERILIMKNKLSNLVVTIKKDRRYSSDEDYADEELAEGIEEGLRDVVLR